MIYNLISYSNTLSIELPNRHAKMFELKGSTKTDAALVCVFDKKRGAKTEGEGGKQQEEE